MALAALTIACCTRNRPLEVERLVASVIVARAQVPDVNLEFMVIDDGELAGDLRSVLAGRLEIAAISWRYFNKRECPGLLQSRIRAVALAAHEWILFVDDDVEIAPTYLAELSSNIAAGPQLSGVGGVDELSAKRSMWRLFLCMLLGLEPVRLGRLSFSGFPSSIGRLGKAKHAFLSERVYGCNMAFRRKALAELGILPGFEGYSLGEDAYLSFVALGSGPLLIDPRLTVRHHHSPAARDGSFDVGRMSICNHNLLMHLFGRPQWRMAGLLISFPALIVLSIARALPSYVRNGERSGLDFARGQLSAMGSLLRGWSPKAEPRRINEPIER